MEFLFNENAQFYLLAYLVGSIPFGLLLAKFFADVDVKASGSKSIGATNVLRVVKEKDPKLAKKLGAATLALDALKGVAVLLLAMATNKPESVLWAVAVLAVIGHCFSIYLWFEGGKGVATAMGVMAILLPLETLIALAVWGHWCKGFKNLINFITLRCSGSDDQLIYHPSRYVSCPDSTHRYYPLL